jgi:multiple sugar transport system ATP-binding protein
MASIRLENLTKTFGDITAIDNINLEIQDGEFFCILGPPGAGKTTLLRLIVGLETPDEGDVHINEDTVNDLHPSKRDIAMIFQNLALYPDRSVFENIAFPLRQRKTGEGEIKQKVVDVAKHLKIDWMLDKTPSQLSGGERQRVAIGRAIVRQPKVYLMDEPLSNLDALLRLEMRVALKEIQTTLKETFVYVTHDQVEALSMGDRIAVLNNGVLQQVDDPETIYNMPQNIFVATILGSPSMNFLKCSLKVENHTVRMGHNAFVIQTNDQGFVDALETSQFEDEIVVGVRPEDISIYLEKPKGDFIDAEVYVTEPLGSETIVDVKLGENVVKVLADPDFPGSPSQRIWASINSSRLHFFHARSHVCLFHASDKSKLEVSQPS